MSAGAWVICRCKRKIEKYLTRNREKEKKKEKKCACQKRRVNRTTKHRRKETVLGMSERKCKGIEKRYSFMCAKIRRKKMSPEGKKKGT